VVLLSIIQSYTGTVAFYIAGGTTSHTIEICTFDCVILEMVSATVHDDLQTCAIRLRKSSSKDFSTATHNDTLDRDGTNTKNNRDKSSYNEQFDEKYLTENEVAPCSPRERNRYPVALVDSVCLVCSSLFFLIPGYFALRKGLYWYLITSVTTTAVSVNYWRHAVPGFRRDLDMIFAKISFAIYFLTGFLNIKDCGVLVLAWPICFAIIGFYTLSSVFWEKDSAFWVYFHMLFHFFVAVEQYLVLFASF
jgi:hypothetical protein